MVDKRRGKKKSLGTQDMVPVLITKIEIVPFLFLFQLTSFLSAISL